MGQIVYRANLASASFPFISALFGRTVIVGGPDQNFIRQLYSPEDPDKDIGVPQAYYLHNTIPSSEGYEAVGYELQSSGPSALTGIRDIHLLYGTDGAKAYICRCDQGVGVYSLPTRRFTLLLALPGLGDITTAIVNGVCYFYIANHGCYTYEPSSGILTPIVLGGLTASAVLGICAASGYMVAYTAITVVWSSLVDPTDFVPSLISGAGGGAVQNIKGPIVCVFSTVWGLAVFSTTNAVSSVYSTNIRYPFPFTEITACGGVNSSELVSYDTTTGNLFAYTSFGLQLVTTQKADLVFPDASDFLAGQVFEDFDETTLEFTLVDLTSALMKRITLISSRYVVVSYGITQLTHALVYDLATRRWGKLKTTHTDCFEYQLLDQIVSDIPRKAIGFVTSDGVVTTVNSDKKSPNRSGVVMFGKYQYVRPYTISLENITLETIFSGFDLDVYLYPSLSGKELPAPVLISPSETRSQSREYSPSTVAVNHSILLLGAYSMSSLLLTFYPHSHI